MSAPAPLPARARRGPLAGRGWHAFVVGVATLSVALVHAPATAYRTIVNVDEGYAMALSERLLEGHKLYEGAISQRGPLMYYLYAAFGWLAGWDNITALRVWGLGLALLHLFLVYGAGRVLVSKTGALIAIAVAAYALAFGFPPEDGMAVNGESLQLPPLVIAAVLGALAVKRATRSRERLVLLVGSGLAFGVAISIKQAVALHPAAVVLLLAVDAHRRADATPHARTHAVRGYARDVATLFVATLVAPLAFVLHAAHEGTLRGLYYYCVTYNRTVHLAPAHEWFSWFPTLVVRLLTAPLFVLTLCMLGASAVPYLARRLAGWRRTRRFGSLVRGFGIRQYIAVHFALAVVAGSSMYRFFPHYYLQAAPFMALAVAMLLERWFERRAQPFAVRAFAVGYLAFLVTIAAFQCDAIERADGRVAHDATVQTLGRIVRATTSPDDRLFVWGFSSWIYPYAERRPAGRYVFSTYVTGFVPWFWEKLDVEKARIVPGSTEALLADLDRERPEVVIDAGSMMMGRSMRAYEAPAAWLHAHYCFDMRVGALDLYRRKPDAAECAATYFPEVHGTVDPFGKPIDDLPVAQTLDHASSRALPPGKFARPLYFRELPPPRGFDLDLAQQIANDDEKAREGLKPDVAR